MRTNRELLWAAALFSLCFAERVGHAGPVGPLTTFTSGTPALASEVNGNFSAVKTAVDDNAARIGTLETTVTPAGNIVLVPSTASTGNILKGTVPFIHNFGVDSTFIGVNAGNFTMTGNFNTASGVSALLNNTTGNSNTASGVNALLNNTTGTENMANGVSALRSNTTGESNTASGVGALIGNTTGDFNTANGRSALFNNTTGSENTASGRRALLSNTTGSNNIAIGANAGNLLTTGSNNIDIGHAGVAAESSTIRIGTALTQTATFIAGINGATSASGTAVLVNASGQLGTLPSSRRLKDDIADMGDASSKLMRLRPVTFHYKTDKDSKGRTLQYGLVAEEVAKVAPGLVARSADGKIETVYYQFLAPMLLNEVQKQQRTIDRQTARIAELEQNREKQTAEMAELKRQTARIEALENQASRMGLLLGRLEQAGMIAAAGR